VRLRFFLATDGGPITDMTMILTVVVRAGLGLLFVLSGVSKFLRARSVGRMVANYRLVPLSLLPIKGE
jgi:uncharacterized membrane protein YphA (DoxX/SURF4 family)